MLNVHAAIVSPHMIRLQVFAILLFGLALLVLTSTHTPDPLSLWYY